MQEQLQDIIKQFVFGAENPVSIRKLSKFSSSASSLAECSDGNKYWLIDIDDKDEIGDDKVNQLSQDFEYIFADKKIVRFKTVNGWHLLIKRNFVSFNARTLCPFSFSKMFLKRFNFSLIF